MVWKQSPRQRKEGGDYVEELDVPGAASGPRMRGKGWCWGYVTHGSMKLILEGSPLVVGY